MKYNKLITIQEIMSQQRDNYQQPYEMKPLYIDIKPHPMSFDVTG